LRAALRQADVTDAERDSSLNEIREVPMVDPFEESLRDMLNASSSTRDDDACLGRVLKTANRQVGAQDLFGLMGRWLQACTLAFSSGSGHVAPVSRRTRATRSTDKVD
jgi:hypothetical protein